MNMIEWLPICSILRRVGDEVRFRRGCSPQCCHWKGHWSTMGIVATEDCLLIHSLELMSTLKKNCCQAVGPVKNMCVKPCYEGGLY